MTSKSRPRVKSVRRRSSRCGDAKAKAAKAQPSRTAGHEIREPSSPVCYLHEFDDEWTDGSARVEVKRVYEPAAPEDGERYLVDRLWPRGVHKDALTISGWLKGVAPSDGLRRWFRHDPERWEEFQRRYREELRANRDALMALRSAMARGPITLIYGAGDERHNHALVLRDVLRVCTGDLPSYGTTL